MAVCFREKAERIIEGKGTLNELKVCSHEIAASTAQLVVSSQVKASKDSSKLAGLVLCFISLAFCICTFVTLSSNNLHLSLPPRLSLHGAPLLPLFSPSLSLTLHPPPSLYSRLLSLSHSPPRLPTCCLFVIDDFLCNLYVK